MENVSRQIRRARERQAAKNEVTALKQAKRKLARRELLERQTRREKEDQYSGPSVASCVAKSRSRLNSRKVQKGALEGRIILTVTGKRERKYHATKGWRDYALSK